MVLKTEAVFPLTTSPKPLPSIWVLEISPYVPYHLPFQLIKIQVLKSFRKIETIMHTLQLILVALPPLLASALGPINIERRTACPTGYAEHSRAPCVLLCHSVRGDEMLRIALDCTATSNLEGSSDIVRRAEGYDHRARCIGLKDKNSYEHVLTDVIHPSHWK
ncbi:hypothetical protein Hypma_008943 [Hypsizygus marmoreus]|uniref:Uncharacterized protein n=1 Tax=Hypsizygus marmoreus TaxID=39966 RepID=A0A369JNM1_HYPMA|nr:hypothetical protein Hypma_008943 [Hypsizygus marmoreus]